MHQLPFKTYNELSVSNALSPIVWQAPSNIAIVKYWGKFSNQIPANPSISFTLNNCVTITELEIQYKNKSGISFELLYESVHKPEFEPKVRTFLEKIVPVFPWLNSVHLRFNTKNTFPHSSGIASSASSMASMASTLVDAERKLLGLNTFDYLKASYAARLGSGSACRSLKGKLVLWGELDAIPESSNLFGCDISHLLHKNFLEYQDVILLVDKGEKAVSSSLGHQLMHNHPFAKERFKMAYKNCLNLIEVLKSGDLDAFIELTENEALTLHALMMSSSPGYVLMKPNTLSIINAIRSFRHETNLPVCFTLDAGANVHLLFPKSIHSKVLEFINNQLVCYCQNQSYICDNIGEGASMFSINR